jgi:hypothetical protein
MVTLGDHRADAAGAEDTEALLPDPYEIVSIRSVPAPTGMSGANWHRYEIKQGDNTIVGYRAGRSESVTLSLESIVLRLNERRKNSRGKVHVLLRSHSGAAKSKSK